MAAKSAHNQKPVKQKYDFFLVLDFEATCDKTAQPSPQEIIEFPVLKVNANTMKIEAVFHKYVRPQFHPQLTTFCTELTGIIQSMVDNQPLFPEVLQSFHQWMESENLLNPDIKSIFVTCGDWDLKTMLPKQCAYLDVDVKPYFSQWINIKKSFAEVTSIYPKGLMVMLNNLNLKHTGRHHSGIDDCHNIANILIALLQKGHTF
ncbi:ERI1 exoribonuclease 3 [Bulinus truncatus]|nr:ERI1 exoribonuclease 3 [Bulinus truncatus]